MRTTFALYPSYESAKKAVDHLVDKNFPKDEINLIVQRSAIENAWQINERTIDVDVADKVGSDYVNKKVDGIDEIIGKQRPIPTPFAGEVYAAGQVARGMARSAADPASRARGLKDVLVDFGVNEESAQRYAEGIRSGQFLILVRTPDERSAELKQAMTETKAGSVATFRG